MHQHCQYYFVVLFVFIASGRDASRGYPNSSQQSTILSQGQFFFLSVILCELVPLGITVGLLLPGSLKPGQSDHSMMRTVNNSKFLGFNCCCPSTPNWFSRLWLKFIVLVLHSDWPVLFK